MIRRSFVVRAPFTPGPQQCCYKVLGLSPHTKHSVEDIKKAYRHHAKITHPDVKGGSEAAYRSVKSAYDEALQRSAGKSTFYTSQMSRPAEDAQGSSASGEWTPPKDFYDHPHSYHRPQPGPQAGPHRWTERQRDQHPEKEWSWDPEEWKEQQRQSQAEYDARREAEGDKDSSSAGMKGAEFARRGYYRTPKDFPDGYTKDEWQARDDGVKWEQAKFRCKVAVLCGLWVYIASIYDDSAWREFEAAKNSPKGYEGTQWGIGGQAPAPKWGSDDLSRASSWVPSSARPMDQVHRERATPDAILNSKFGSSANNNSNGNTSYIDPILRFNRPAPISKGTQMTSIGHSFGGYPYTPEGLAAKRAAQRRKAEEEDNNSTGANSVEVVVEGTAPPAAKAQRKLSARSSPAPVSADDEDDRCYV